MVLCTNQVRHVVPRKIYPLEYYGPPLLFLVGLLVCSFSQITRISVRRMTGVGVVFIDMAC